VFAGLGGKMTAESLKLREIEAMERLADVTETADMAVLPQDLAAKRLRVSVRWLQEMAGDNKITGQKKGKVWYFCKSVLDMWATDNSAVEAAMAYVPRK